VKLSVYDGDLNDKVQLFAQKIGIAPGIVAGRLQHERGAYKRFAELFEKYILVND
jgi:HTH-type transcriptional regulator/antitoxin HigA